LLSLIFDPNLLILSDLSLSIGIAVPELTGIAASNRYDNIFTGATACKNKFTH